MRLNFQTVTQLHAARPPRDRRATSRRPASIPGRLIWRDHWGTPRFTSVVTRNVGDRGVFVECLGGQPIPVHRLVHLQIDRATRGFEYLPDTLRQGKVLAAVYRVGGVSPSTGVPEGYALRLLVEPSRPALAVQPFTGCAPVALPA